MDKNIGEDDVFEEELDDLDLEDSAPEPIMPTRPVAPVVNGADDNLQPQQIQQSRGRGRPPKVQSQVQPQIAPKPVQQTAQVAPAQAQPQVIAVPRVVSIDQMLNELYDGQQEIRQVLLAILEKLK